MQLIGDVEGKDVILLDDIIDTGNTICKATQIIKDNGAKSVRAMITHPLLTGNAYQNIGIQAVVEYYPFNNKHTKDLRFHAMYGYQSTDFEEEFANLSVQNENTFLIGMRWLFKVK